MYDYVFFNTFVLFLDFAFAKLFSVVIAVLTGDPVLTPALLINLPVLVCVLVSLTIGVFVTYRVKQIIFKYLKSDFIHEDFK